MGFLKVNLKDTGKWTKELLLLQRKKTPKDNDSGRSEADGIYVHQFRSLKFWSTVKVAVSYT